MTPMFEEKEDDYFLRMLMNPDCFLTFTYPPPSLAPPAPRANILCFTARQILVFFLP
jgi:hypothetical protein